MGKPSASDFGMKGTAFLDAADDAMEQVQESAVNQEEEDERPTEDDGSSDEGGFDAGDDGSDEDGDDGDGEDGASEEDSGNDEEDSEEDSEEEEEESDSKEDSSPEKPKVYTATLEDGSQVKLPDDATVKLKVDGKFKRVSIKELASGYNGQIKHDELIRRSAETKKELETRLSQAQAKSERAKDLTKTFVDAVASKGDIIEAMAVIAEMTDHENPDELLQSFMTGLGKAIDEVSQMSEEDIQKRARAYKTDSELKRKESKLSELEKKEQAESARAYRKQLEQELELEPTEMEEAYKALVSRNEALAKEGKDPINFTLDDVAVLAVDFRHYDAVKSVSEAHNLDLEPKDLNLLVDSAKIAVRRLGRYPNESEYRQLVSQYVNKELEAISRKVGSSKKTTPKKKNTGKSKVKEVKRLSEIWD